MSDDYNIKISELNPPPTPPITEDFFPLVHSASMTTYRASIQDIGCLITHSIYADTASYLKDYAPTVSASWASASISASYAKTDRLSVAGREACVPGFVHTTMAAATVRTASRIFTLAIAA